MTRKTITRKAGYIFAERFGPWDSVGCIGLGGGEPTWHRTKEGAFKAREKSEVGGYVFRITGDDTAEEIMS